MTTPQSAVTVLGLGPMGRALAGAFLAAGVPTTVWNRTASRAGALAASQGWLKRRWLPNGSIRVSTVPVSPSSRPGFRNGYGLAASSACRSRTPPVVMWRAVPGVPSLLGSAEDIPLPDGSADGDRVVDGNRRRGMVQVGAEAREAEFDERLPVERHDEPVLLAGLSRQRGLHADAADLDLQIVRDLGEQAILERVDQTLGLILVVLGHAQTLGDTAIQIQ